MDLFNKKQVRKLKEEVLLLKQEIAIKNDVLEKINIQKNMGANENLVEQNKTLINWILKLLETNGYQMPERIPYFKVVRSIPRLNCVVSSPERLMRIYEERYMVPAIEITKMNIGDDE